MAPATALCSFALLFPLACAEVVDPLPPPPPPPHAASPIDLEASARADFSRAISCPESRVMSSASTETAETPPVEVAADPERMTVWRENHRGTVST
jgi:hypothetical protein